LVESISKKQVCFGGGHSVSFWLCHCYLEKVYPTFSFKIILNVIMTITVMLRSAKHE